MILTYNKLVQRDISEICDHYEDAREGLNDAFFAEFESTIDSIK